MKILSSGGNMSTYAISVKNVSKSFGSNQAVNNLSFRVGESTCFGLLGPNGAGKTTMMKMVYGVSERDSQSDGAISVFGHDPENDSLAIKFVSGVVPQENNFDQELNVQENLRIFGHFYTLPSDIAVKRINELLEFMELTDKNRVRVRELSGGMKRRLIIARALINQPRLLILDEPTTGLDPQVRHLIWEKLRNLKKQGMTILLTTHYMEEAFQLCDTILIMNKGLRVIEGNPHILVKKNIEPFVLEVYTREAFGTIKTLLPEPVRTDESTEVVRIYGGDQSSLHQLSSRLKPGDSFLRQSNLEDLFLKTTGSSLNAIQ
jgi:lipooligosaccharide transport system ATP-binding protein